MYTVILCYLKIIFSGLSTVAIVVKPIVKIKGIACAHNKLYLYLIVWFVCLIGLRFSSVIAGSSIPVQREWLPKVSGIARKIFRKLEKAGFAFAFFEERNTHNSHA
jgi:hypothetical protein